jgi:hypothetical protein
VDQLTLTGFRRELIKITTCKRIFELNYFNTHWGKLLLDGFLGFEPRVAQSVLRDATACTEYRIATEYTHVNATHIFLHSNICGVFPVYSYMHILWLYDCCSVQLHATVCLPWQKELLVLLID